MWARVARFEGDPADIDAKLQRLRPAPDAGTFLSELADAKLLMLAKWTQRQPEIPTEPLENLQIWLNQAPKQRSPLTDSNR